MIPRAGQDYLPAKNSLILVKTFLKDFWSTLPKVQKPIGGRLNSLRTVSSNWKENGIIANFRKGNNVFKMKNQIILINL